ncbi:G-protein coupled receptor family C group 6 member A-like [Centroberyx gerrardi]
MKHFFSFYIFASVFLYQVYGNHDNIMNGMSATAPGDIIIGGLFPIHESVNITIAEDGRETRTCNRFNTARLVQSLMMVQMVEEVNRRHELGNLSLGYHILDSCSDVTTALEQSLAFMRRGSGEGEDSSMDGAELPSPPVLAVIGGYHSEISIAVARQLNLEHIPQISYGSTSGLLSDKNRFPNFMRTVPEDDHQARAIVQILKEQNWTWVGVVTTDGDYGRYALDRLQHHAAENNICLAFTSILPDVLSDYNLKGRIKATVKSIIDNPNVKVIVSFAKPDHMMYLFNSLLQDWRGRGKVWVASDNWSESRRVLRNWTLSDAGTIIGVTLKSANTSKLLQYLSNLDVNPDDHKNNTFLHRFLQEHGEKQQGLGYKQSVGLEVAQKASSTQGELGMRLDRVKRDKPVKPSDSANEMLKKKIYPYAVLSVGLAVRAVAQAVADLCVNRDCKTSQRLQPWELRGALRTAMFHMDGQYYTFDKRGDLNTGYDVILWRQISPTFVDVHDIIAYYSIQNKKLTFTSGQDFVNLTEEVVSRCSNSCAPGFRRQSAVGQPVCCYECVPCPENYFSSDTDSAVCRHCDTDTHYSRMGSASCTRKKTVFLGWENTYCIILLAFTALAAALTLVAGIIFIVYWNTPVVRASVGPISLLLLLSLLGTFVSVVFFGGRPTRWQCQARQILFGLSFTLCVSCILVKSCKIVFAFEFDPSVQRVLKKLYKPYIIIAVCISLQVVICGLWLALQSPRPKWELLKNKEERLFKCDERSFGAFGAMLSYIGLLALIGFVFAFKGRKLPHSYNEAKFITFGMLIYFICWIIFGPVYANVKGLYSPAVEMGVILISAFGILFCHFLPKCYIILFKQEANTESAFQQDIRSYSMGEMLVEGGAHQLSPPLGSGGHQNLALEMETPASNSVPDQRSATGPSLSDFPDSKPRPTEQLNEYILKNSRKQLKKYSSFPA